MNNLITDTQGNNHFYLKKNELAIFDFFNEFFRLNINETEYYELNYAETKSLIVETSEQIKYTPSTHVQTILDMVDQLGVLQGTCVDIGAFDGYNYSNTLPLFERGWNGLLVECNLGRFTSLSHLYRAFKKTRLARTIVSPGNVVSLLQGFDIPVDFDFLSLDIDSYDYFVLEAILASFRPSIIVAEINEVIPPPIKFAVHYDPDFELSLEKRFYGQSLAQLNKLCERFDYAIIGMYYMDVFLIDKKYTAGQSLSLDEIYDKGVRSRPLMTYYADYPFDVASVMHTSPQDALVAIQEGYAEFAGKFTCEL